MYVCPSHPDTGSPSCASAVLLHPEKTRAAANAVVTTQAYNEALIVGIGIGIGIGVGIGIGIGIDCGIDFGIDFGLVFGIDFGLDCGIGLDFDLGLELGISSTSSLLRRIFDVSLASPP